MDQHPSPRPPQPGEPHPWTTPEIAPLPASEPWGDGSALRQVPFAAPVGFRPLLLDLYLPAGRACPVLVWIHGGAFMLGSRALVSPVVERADLFRRLPGVGVAVAAIDYRLSGEARFPAQLHDVKAAIRWLRVRGPEVGIDPSRIAVWGESAGGHLAAMATLTGEVPHLEGDVGETRASSGVTAGIDWYGPTDFAAMDRDAPPDSAMCHDAPDSPESLLLGAPVQERPDLVARADPCAYARPGLPPLLVQHGTRDRMVPFGQSVRLVDALRASGSEVMFVPVQDAGHDFEGVADETPIVGTAIDFLLRELRVVHGS